MSALFYNVGLSGLVDGTIDLDGDDIRVLLVMTNTTVDSENSGISTVNDFTTLDNFDGSGYTPASGLSLSGGSVSIDASNRRAEFDANDISGLSLGNGTRQIQGLLFIKFVTNVNSSIPIAFDDGYRRITCASTIPGSSTSVPVDPLKYPLESGSTVAFSGGTTVSLTSSASVGDRSLSVSSTSGGVAAGESGEASVLAAPAFPVNGSDFTGVSWSSSGIFHFQNPA